MTRVWSSWSGGPTRNNPGTWRRHSRARQGLTASARRTCPTWRAMLEDMSALALSIDPAPAAAERVIARLPAQLRAALQWYPPAFRREVLEPLRSAPEPWRATLDERCLVAAKLMVRFGQSIAAGFREPHARDLLAAAADVKDQTEAMPASRLELVDQLAADQLREGQEWLKTLLPVFAAAFLTPDVDDALKEMASDDAAVKEALRGDFGTYMQGLVLLAAASEAVADTSRPLPEPIVEWCDVAFHALHVALRGLRARGIPLPFEVPIPGFTARQWRERWAARVFEGMSDHAMTDLEKVMRRRPRASSNP